MLAEQLLDYIAACFTGIWIESSEHDEAQREIAQLCQQEQWRLATWDLDVGLRVAGWHEPESTPAASDPLGAIHALPGLAANQNTTLLLLTNFHRFLGSPEIVQALISQVLQGKQSRSFIVILAPTVQLPLELEKLFVVLEHALPNRQQLEAIAQSLIAGPAELPPGQIIAGVLDAAAGLTRYEAEGAFSLSLTRHGRITADAVWELKTGILKKRGLVSLHRGAEGFASLGGLEALKSFCKRCLLQSTAQPAARPRGVLLLGVPGTGKSAFAKALGHETGRPTLVLDVGALLGSLVGQTEANIRQALRIADAMAPAILFIDECEKALSGADSSAQGDSGVAARLLGTLLTWMNDHTSDVYVVATCNDIARLPPEFSRAERFDGVFFLNLPDASEKQAIWDLYLRRFQLDPAQGQPNDANWTGAEIRACCRLAALLDVPLRQAAQNVVPVAATAAESVQRLRTWASGRCLRADQPGLYQLPSAGSARPRRRISRDPSAN